MSVPSYLIEPLSIIWRNGPISDPFASYKEFPQVSSRRFILEKPWLWKLKKQLGSS